MKVFLKKLILKEWVWSSPLSSRVCFHPTFLMSWKSASLSQPLEMLCSEKVDWSCKSMQYKSAPTRRIMRYQKIFILKQCSVYGHLAITVPACEIATLNYVPRNDAMEHRVFIAIPTFTCWLKPSILIYVIIFKLSDRVWNKRKCHFILLKISGGFCVIDIVQWDF